MKKRCFILSRWEGENYVIGGETLLPPLLNEHNIEDINVEGEGALGIGGDQAPPSQPFKSLVEFKYVKKEQHTTRAWECHLHVQVKSTTNMVEDAKLKAQVLEH